MTPNPTARPFIVGALMFLALIGLWPQGGHTPRESTVLASEGRVSVTTPARKVVVPAATPGSAPRPDSTAD